MATGDVRLKIRDILGAFMFGGEASDKKVKVLSGGERSRLAMIKLLLEPVNFLILDEPTNHLDMQTKDVLKEALMAFDGTIILVSHDRDFLDGLAERVYAFSDGRVREHIGGIYDYLTQEAPAIGTAMPGKSSPASEQQKPQGGAEAHAAMKERAREVRKAEKAVAEAETTIERIEQEISELEAKLSTAEGAADANLAASYAAKQKELNETMNLWEQASEALSKLK